jgi:hypothetical protein
METAHFLLPISAARRPPAVEACFLPRSLLQGESAAVEEDRRFEILAVSEAAHTAFD